MDSKSPKSSVVYENSNSAFINLRLSVKDAKAILDGHKNITNVAMEEIRKAWVFLQNSELG